MKTADSVKRGKSDFFLSLIKGSLIALSISLIGICVFAFILRFIDISVDAIKPINQVIKFGSIIIGTFMGLKKAKEMGLVSGFLIGSIYTLLAFLVFSILNGGMTFDTSLLNDTIFGGIAGGISGVVAVNFKKKWFKNTYIKSIVRRGLTMFFFVNN